MNQLEEMREGLPSAVMVVGLGLLIALGMTVDVEMGWATVDLNAMVPTQMVMTLFWHGKYPPMLDGVRQPLRGLL